MEGTDPVKLNKKFLAALSGAALLLTLAGCSDDSNKKLDNWAQGVCDQAAAQTKKINDANTAITQVNGNGKPQDVKSADSAAFQSISEAYKSLADIVSKAGAPPVDDGAKIQQDAVSDLNGLSTEYATLKKQVDGLDTSDQGKFADGLKGVSDSLAKVSKNGEQALDTLRQGDVGKAMAKQPGCKQASSSPSASPAAS
ncbi:small secreted protein [Streptomyces sp. NPDC051976]|uniref:small secreted protein n=1 Tax=Streptomyces sp. NPDC051976 TaxID=3154947 RepID=UPI00342DA782